jgi:granule-bound starch synthase
VVILGTGKAKYEQLVKSMSTKNPNFKGVVKFSAPMAHQITAGADFILVPSRWVLSGVVYTFCHLLLCLNAFINHPS